MGDINPSQPALLFQALTVSDPHLFDEVEKLFIKRYGSIKSDMGPLRFDAFTNYYQAEMGKALWKKYYIFSQRITLEHLYRYKIDSQSLESRYLSSGKRRINCDPGYLTLYQLGLLSTKAYSHRIYLSEGIYAECTLIAHGSKYSPLPWTYPDYRTHEALAFFARAKTHLKQMIP